MKSVAAAEQYIESVTEKDSYGLTESEAKELREKYTCSLKGFHLKNQDRMGSIYEKNADDRRSIRIVKEYYALSPEPIHQTEVNENTYITLAKQTRNLDYVYFFLHFYEKKLNGRIEKIISPQTDLSIQIEQYMEIKIRCREYIFKKFLSFDETRGVQFTSYIFEGIRGAILKALMPYSEHSFSSVDEFADFRRMAYLIDKENTFNTAKQKKYIGAVRLFAKQNGCSRATAYDIARAVIDNDFRVVEVEIENDDDGSTETIDFFQQYADPNPEGWTDDDSACSFPSEILAEAFGNLSYREQRIIEKRLAISMKSKTAYDPKSGESFEDIATDFELSSPRAAELIFRKALDKMARFLTENSE